MSVLLRFLGIDSRTSERVDDDGPLARIVRELDDLPPERARFYACFAYVLARVAGADLHIDDAEVAAMEDVLVRCAGIPAEEAALTVRIVRSEVEHLGGTHNYLVTQEFGRLSSADERLQLIECLYSVAAADETITGDEHNDIVSIASEIGIPRHDVLAIRSRFRDKLAELRPLSSE